MKKKMLDIGASVKNYDYKGAAEGVKNYDYKKAMEDTKESVKNYDYKGAATKAGESIKNYDYKGKADAVKNYDYKGAYDAVVTHEVTENTIVTMKKAKDNVVQSVRKRRQRLQQDDNSTNQGAMV